MQGYFENPEATAAVVREGGWIDTGDLGYPRRDGELYVTGRAKDVIIARRPQHLPAGGRGGHRASVPASGAAALPPSACRTRKTGTERLVVVAETRGALHPTTRRCTTTSPPASSPRSACLPT